jgi:hypothetical protein
MWLSGFAERQYTQRKLQRLVIETRRSVMWRPNLSVRGTWLLDAPFAERASMIATLSARKQQSTSVTHGGRDGAENRPNG